MSITVNIYYTGTGGAAGDFGGKRCNKGAKTAQKGKKESSL